MSKTYYRWLGSLLLFLFFFAAQSHGQSLRSGDMGRGDLFGNERNTSANPFENPDEEGEETPADSTKQRKPRKPLESWFFDDSVRSRKNFAWTLDMYRNNVNMTVIDTLLDGFNTDYPFLKVGVGDAYLGNLGGGSYPLAYHLRPAQQDFSFTQPYYAYIYNSENAPYYNVKKPYTRLGYLTAGQKRVAEENFSVIHAQNASPSLGFNVTYHTQGTRGIYINQRTKNTDFSGGVSYTGKRYSAHGGYIFNTLDMRDNGGVINDWFITDTIMERPTSVPVWLQANTSGADGARNLIKNNSFYTIHTYGVPLRRLTEDDFTMANTPAFYVGYAFQYDRWSRRYTDLREYSGENYAEMTDRPDRYPDYEYYKDWFINDRQTRDSIFESKLSNRLFIQLQPWDRDGIVGTIDAGAGIDAHHYYMFHPDDYLSGSNKGENMMSYYFYGSVEGKFRQYFNWSGQARITPFGYKQGDIDAQANVQASVYFRQRPVSLSGKISYQLKEPSYWSENYYSNHFIWSNSFSKENETRIEAKLEIPHINMEVSFHQSVSGNKIYYQATGSDLRTISPVQSSDIVSVTGVYARKDFRLGGFHMNNRVMLQWSTNHSVAPVPLASVYLSWFYEFDVVRGVLRMRAGLDGRYNTRYYAHGYNPAISQFYNQQQKQIGNYPMVDVFITAKWKRMRIFLKLAHASENLFGTREYFSVLNYPHNRRIFKYGISWSFYD